MFWLILMISGHIKSTVAENSGSASCSRTNCTVDMGNGFTVSYLSLQKFDDWKLNPTYFGSPPDETHSVAGPTQKARQRECAEKCMKDGNSLCQTAQLSPFVSASPSTCELFKKDVYNLFGSHRIAVRSSSIGWTAFHVLVREKFETFYVHSISIIS